MKTIPKEFYQQIIDKMGWLCYSLPEDVFLKLHKHFNDSDLTYSEIEEIAKYDNPTVVIDMGFNWKKTQEGYDYWLAVADNASDKYHAELRDPNN